MKSFIMDWVVPVIVMYMAWQIGDYLLIDKTISKQQIEQAVQKCKLGEWEKIDHSTIYCKDGAEYKLKGE